MSLSVTPFGPQLQEKRFIGMFCLISGLVFIPTILITVLAIWAYVTYDRENSIRVPQLRLTYIIVMILSPIFIICLLAHMFISGVVWDFKIWRLVLEVSAVLSLCVAGYMAFMISRAAGDENPIDTYKKLSNISQSGDQRPEDFVRRPEPEFRHVPDHTEHAVDDTNNL